MPNFYWKDITNVEEAVHHTLTELHPELKSKNRTAVIETIISLPRDLRNYFRRIGLSRAKRSLKTESPLAVLRVFDTVYQRLTENASLFDQTQRYYLTQSGTKCLTLARNGTRI